MKCRHCGTEVNLPFVDLGSAPPSNAYLTTEGLHAPETWYPLRVLVCTECWLAQTEDFAGREELFADDYAYFSSYSSTWLAHAQAFVADMVERFALDASSLVAEIAANDGYLLQYVKARGIPCYGVEPTAGAAAAALAKGIEIIECFFGKDSAQEMATAGRQADLIVANNVLAHVPDINDFIAGFTTLLKSHGVATFEFPHLLRLVSDNQFDTIYHEHYSYLSFTTVKRIFSENGLTVFDVQELPTHGGSLRVFTRRANSDKSWVSPTVAELLQREEHIGMQTPVFYAGFQPRADRAKNDLLAFLLEAKRSGKRVVGYGAAAKGNTLLNFAGARPDLIEFVVDRNTAKQDKYMPGSRIPIVAEKRIREQKPDYVLILPWNIKDEIMRQLWYVSDWGGAFVVSIPALELIQADKL